MVLANKRDNNDIDKLHIITRLQSMVSKGLVFLVEKVLLQINFHRKKNDAIIFKKQNIGRKINELV